MHRRATTLAATLTALFLLCVSGAAAQEEAPYRVVGYYTSYSIYEEQYLVTDIPIHLLTHLNYAYVDISTNLQCESADDWADTGYSYPGDVASERVRGNFKQLQLLRGDHPDLKIMMSIGGWEHSSRFSDAALTEESRTRFVRSCIAYMRANGFDGIDLDWRFPVVGGKDPLAARPEDSENFALLVSEFRAQIDAWSTDDARRYLLTITAPAVETLYSPMRLELLHGNLDWINLTSFGFFGVWSPYAGHHAALYLNERDSAGDSALTVSGAVSAYLDMGVPADKIVVGVGLYAQTWRNVRPNDYFGLFQTAEGVPTGTRTGGILYYEDLGSFLSSPSYVRFFDDAARAAWMYNADRRIAISYENEESILNKAAYVRNLRLGGIAVWELAFDDNAHTLLNSVYRGLYGSR